MTPLLQLFNNVHLSCYMINMLIHGSAACCVCGSHADKVILLSVIIRKMAQCRLKQAFWNLWPLLNLIWKLNLDLCKQICSESWALVLCCGGANKLQDIGTHVLDIFHVTVVWLAVLLLLGTDYFTTSATSYSNGASLTWRSTRGNKVVTFSSTNAAGIPMWLP